MTVHQLLIFWIRHENKRVCIENKREENLREALNYQRLRPTVQNIYFAVVNDTEKVTDVSNNWKKRNCFN